MAINGQKSIFKLVKKEKQIEETRNLDEDSIEKIIESEDDSKNKI